MENFSPKKASSVCVQHKKFVFLFLFFACLFVVICLTDNFNFPPEAPFGQHNEAPTGQISCFILCIKKIKVTKS